MLGDNNKSKIECNQATYFNSCCHNSFNGREIYFIIKHGVLSHFKYSFHWNSAQNGRNL